MRFAQLGRSATSPTGSPPRSSSAAAPPVSQTGCRGGRDSSRCYGGDEVVSPHHDALTCTNTVAQPRLPGDWFSSPEQPAGQVGRTCEDVEMARKQATMTPMAGGGTGSRVVWLLVDLAVRGM